MKKYLITGGAGFVGSHLAERLVEEGSEVTIIDNLSTGKLENISEITSTLLGAGKNQITFIQADIRDTDGLGKINSKFDAIIHLAAQVYVHKSILNPQETYDINIAGTLNILELAKKLNIKKIIFASSSAVYGNLNKNSIDETDELKPISPYGISKLKAEELLRNYSESYQITTVNLRFFNIYGPHQDANSPYSGVITNFIKKIKQNEKPIIYGKGEQTRDFIYIEDIVEGIVGSLKLQDGRNHTYNLGTGKTISINELLSLIARILVKDNLEPLYKSSRKGDILFSGASIAKIKKELDFLPKYGINEGLKKLVS
jgi:UDP-glucose 4-epimerase